MDSIEGMSQGWWRPSPGSIYPLLADLERDGLIRKNEDGRYELTPRSREEVEWLPGMSGNRPHGIPEMLDEMDAYVAYFEDVRKSDGPKLQPHRDRLRKIADRLIAIAGGGKVA